MAQETYLDELGNWIGSQGDLGHDLPDDIKDPFPGSLTAEDQEATLRGSLPAGNVTRVKDESDSIEGLRSAPAADDKGSDVPATAAGDKVTVDGKKATNDSEAAPISTPATSEASASTVDEKVKARRKAE